VKLKGELDHCQRNVNTPHPSCSKFSVLSRIGLAHGGGGRKGYFENVSSPAKYHTLVFSRTLDWKKPSGTEDQEVPREPLCAAMRKGGEETFSYYLEGTGFLPWKMRKTTEGLRKRWPMGMILPVDKSQQGYQGTPRSTKKAR